jgi:hypothetical protein
MNLTYSVLRTQDKTAAVKTIFYVAQQKYNTKKAQLSRHGYRLKCSKKR